MTDSKYRRNEGETDKDLLDRLNNVENKKIVIELEDERWISAKEKNPEKEGDYLCKLKNGTICIRSFKFTFSQNHPKITEKLVWVFRVQITRKITHWMEIPRKKYNKKIKFDWEFIGDGLHGKFSNYRAKVFGGWIVKEITWNEHDDSISMVFLNDKNHEWEIDNE